MVEDAIAGFGKEGRRKEGGRLMTRLSLEGCPCFEVVPLAPVKSPRPGSPPHLVWGGGRLRRQEPAKKARTPRVWVGRSREALDWGGTGDTESRRFPLLTMNKV